jgi:putative RecB family exonuclease
VDRVDATDSGYEVIDYKLDREIRTQAQVDDDLQLGLYHVALEGAQGITPESLTLYFLRHNLQRTTVRTREQGRELSRWVIATGGDIQNDRQWKPCVGDHCGGCDFRTSCPAHTGGQLAPLQRTPRMDAQMPLLLLDEPFTEGYGTNAADPDDSPESQLSLPLT